MSASSASVRSAHTPDAVDQTVEARVLEERARWAMRIHDGLTQTVTSAVLELQTLRTRILADPAGAVASLSAVEAAIRADLREIRQMLFDLYEDQRPPEPPMATFVDELLARWGLPARVTIDGDVDAVPLGVLETAHAVLAESLANAAKHAGTSDVAVHIAAECRADADRGHRSRPWDRGRRRRRSALRAQHDAGPRRGYRWNLGDRIDARGRDPCGRAPSRRRARRGTMRILIVDDHALVRRGMAYVVKEGFPDADVVEAEGAAAALDVMRIKAADLALVDVRMPDLDGLELLRAMKLEWPDVPVIMLSTYENAPYVKRALSDGAAGYLLKDATPEDLGQAINVAISGGGNVLSPRVIQNLFEDVESSAARRRTAIEVAPDRVQPDAARARHPGAAVRGSEQPLDRAEPVPVGEDREGSPGRDLPQARRHEPHAGRDDGRADGRGSGAGRADGNGARTAQSASPRTPRRSGSASVPAVPGTCSSSTWSRTARRPASSAGRTRSARSSSPGRS